MTSSHLQIQILQIPRSKMACCWTLYKTWRHLKHPLQMVCSWALLPSSSATTLARAFSTTTNVQQSLVTLLHWENNSSAFCPGPHFKCPMAVRVTTFQDGILFSTPDKHPQSFHISHTCQPSNWLLDVRVLTTIQLTEWSFHEHAFHLYVPKPAHALISWT
jgi:hypothetical protein